MKSDMDSINNYLMHNFANLAEEVENRLDYLNNLRVSVEAMLLKCPEGKLKVSPGGTEETFRIISGNPRFFKCRDESVRPIYM